MPIRHSGARRRREPGIQSNTASGLSAPGFRVHRFAVSRNDEGAAVARRHNWGLYASNITTIASRSSSMTAIRGYVAPTKDTDALGVHSLDQFVLAVPDASVAQDFYGQFG